jgi:hypothetical protein
MTSKSSTPNAKIFCLGFQKTGTSSLAIALEHLGYRVCGYHQFRDLAAGPALTTAVIHDRVRSLLDEYDAFKDTPWPVLFKELDQWCPGSRFIVVIRDPKKWIRSASRDFQRYPNEIHRWIYGSAFPVGNEDAWIRRYTTHNREVQEYFAGRSDDLLTLQLDDGEVNWRSICNFLGHDVPDRPWPHANKIREKRWGAFKAKVRRRLFG